MKGFVTLIFPAVLAVAVAAPLPQDESSNPFAVIGNFIQRLQTSFNEGSESIRTQQDNGLYPITPESPSISSKGPSTTTSTPTTTPRTTTSPPTRPRPTNPFDSINAILDNISRGSSNNNNIPPPPPSNVFGSVPGRNLLPDSGFSTPAPFFPPPPTTRQPFNIDGINQGINAFFQAFLKTNIEKIFKPGQGESKNTITRRSDPPEGPPPSLGDIIINSFLGKNKQF